MAIIQELLQELLQEFKIMNKIFIFASILLNITLFCAQGVGIGTTSPTQTLDVNGNTKLTGELFFENPGVYTGAATNSYLIVRDNSDKVLKRYVPATAQYSAINSTVYHITNINTAGLADFNTGISSSNYYLIIGGFILRGVNDASSIRITQPSGTSEYIPQYSARAFEQNGTWHIKFTPNNRRVFNQNPEIRLSVSIYRKDMLTTVNNVITVNMSNNTAGMATATAPNLP